MPPKYFTILISQVLGFNYHFEWPSQDVPLEPYKWFSFCIILDQEVIMYTAPGFVKHYL